MQELTSPPSGNGGDDVRGGASLQFLRQDEALACCRMPMLQVSGREHLGGGSAATAAQWRVDGHGGTTWIVGRRRATEIVDQCRDFFENLQRKVTDAIL